MGHSDAITIDATTRLIGSSPAVAMAMLPSMPDTISSTSEAVIPTIVQPMK